MPFKSDAQRKFMYAQHPEIAKKWRKKYGPQRDIPARKPDGPVEGLRRARPKRKDDDTD